MFGLLTRSPQNRKPLVRRSTTLCLERLEDRLTPSGGAGEAITINVTYLQGQQATFSGQLYNQNGPVANQTIVLTGVVATTTNTDSLGNYSTTVSIPQLGTENAASADGNSNTSQVAMQAGSIAITSFSGVYVGNNLWSFSGTVGGETTQGSVIYFGGSLQGQSTTVNADGTFNFYAIIPPGDGGFATAQAVDWWGDLSMVSMTMTLPQPMPLPQP